MYPFTVDLPKQERFLSSTGYFRPNEECYITAYTNYGIRLTALVLETDIFGNPTLIDSQGLFYIQDRNGLWVCRESRYLRFFK